MCTLKEEIIDKDCILGYKVVHVKPDGKYYSIAMGFCYNDFERIPEVEEQNNELGLFRNDILSNVYYSRMVGRTAVFENRMDAERMARDFLYDGQNRGREDIINPSSIKVKRAKVYRDIMKGFYGETWCTVYAGRVIEFLD